MKTNETPSFTPNIQLFADDGAPSTSTGETTHPDTETPNMASESDENGTPTTGSKPFKSFATQSEFDQFVQQTLKSRENSIREKLTPEIKKQLDKESRMTAEQKVQSQLDALELEKKEIAKEKVRIKAEALFASKGISESDRQPMLDSVVNEDEKSSLERAQALIDAIEKATNEKVKAAMVNVKVPNSGGGQNHDPKASKAVSFAKKMSERRAASEKAANSILDEYIGGNF